MSKTLVVVQLNTLKNVWAIGMQNVGSTVRTKAQEAEWRFVGHVKHSSIYLKSGGKSSQLLHASGSIIRFTF